MRLARVIRHVPDVTASADFYARAFGLVQRIALGEDYVAMETGDTVLGFAREGFIARETGLAFAPSRADGPPGTQEIAFEVEDVRAAHAHALSEGATELVAPIDKPWGQTMSYLRDPDGGLVQLCSPLAAPPPALYLEDLTPGRIFRAGPVTVTQAEVLEFAGRYDPQPFHTDPEAATTHPLFQGLAASGWHTAALTMRMASVRRSRSIA